jgi:hypothetical protein
MPAMAVEPYQSVVGDNFTDSCSALHDHRYDFESLYVNGELKIGAADPFVKKIKRNVNVLKCSTVFLHLNLVVIGSKTDDCDEFLTRVGY